MLARQLGLDEDLRRNAEDHGIELDETGDVLVERRRGQLGDQVHPVGDPARPRNEMVVDVGERGISSTLYTDTETIDRMRRGWSEGFALFRKRWSSIRECIEGVIANVSDVEKLGRIKYEDSIIARAVPLWWK